MIIFLKRAIVRTILFGYFLFHLGMLYAQTYYVSPSGNDANSGISPATAWATIERVNQEVPLLGPGNTVLFERGGIYYGSIQVKYVHGTADHPITFGAYGVGEEPVISGAKQISDWTQIDQNLWQAHVAEHPDAIDILFINGKKYYPARFPNKGYRKVTNYYAPGLQDNTLSFPDGYWDGATVAFKSHSYTIFRDTISHSYDDGRIDVMETMNDMLPQADWGYFIQNHLHAIDLIGEWAYDKYEGTIVLCSQENPNKQQVEYSHFENGFFTFYTTLYGDCFVVVENLCFQHYRRHAVSCNSSHNFVVQGCTFRNCQSAIELYYADQCRIVENKVHDLEVIGVEINEVNDSYIQDNTIQRIGLSLDGGQHGFGLCVGIAGGYNNRNEISRNNIDSTGYCGICIGGMQDLLIKNNVVDHSLLQFSDGGGIYLTGIGFTGNQIKDNIVLNAIGSNEGTPWENQLLLRNGIALDDGTNHVLIDGNTVAYSGGGIAFHGAQGNRVVNNVLYNNNIIANISMQDMDDSPVSSNTIEQNYMYQVSGLSYYMDISSGINSYTTSNKIDNNYISAPFSQYFADMPGSAVDCTTWIEKTNFDLHSQSEPVLYSTSGAESPEKFAVLAYNPTSKDAVIALDNTYMSFDGIVYAGSIKLAPFKSAILFRCKDNGGVSEAPILPSASFLVFPNPVRKGQSLTVQTGMETSIDEFEISIYDLNGKLQKQYHSKQTEISLPAPDNAGYYILRLKAKKDGIVQNATIVVQ
ncbi:MAG: right-handed parallel beta-helix repeat-containing protein [Tannerella sp.]|jgi:parallel beta-helix repeat protein|nr:right-handed parallel beta-helix repeat-containing protein [Tannerella sp.]